MRLDQGEVGVQRRLQQILLAVDLDHLLAFGHGRTQARRRQNAAQSVAGGANALGHRALRDQFHVHLAGDHLAARLGIQADVGGDQLVDGLDRDQLADAEVRPARVVGDDSKVFFALPDEFVDDAMRRADSHESADHQNRAVRDHLDRFGARNCFVDHELPFMYEGEILVANSGANAAAGRLPPEGGKPPDAPVLTGKSYGNAADAHVRHITGTCERRRAHGASAGSNAGENPLPQAGRLAPWHGLSAFDQRVCTRAPTFLSPMLLGGTVRHRPARSLM